MLDDAKLTEINGPVVAESGPTLYDGGPYTHLTLPTSALVSNSVVAGSFKKKKTLHTHEN